MNSFSRDSSTIRCNNRSQEILFFQSFDGQAINGPSQLRDIVWETQNCIYGWSVKGLWNTEDSEVNAVDETNDKKMLVSSNKTRLQIHRNPCPDEKCQCISLHGHSSEISNVRFNASDSHIISIGKKTRGIMQWKIEKKPEGLILESFL